VSSDPNKKPLKETANKNIRSDSFLLGDEKLGYSSDSEDESKDSESSLIPIKKEPKVATIVP